jgi:hypothetical protein
VVTLAPNYEGRLVTSQRGRVVAINQRAQTLTMATDDGRRVILRGQALDADHLDHGYALTVHREPGATADHTHYLAEGGGASAQAFQVAIDSLGFIDRAAALADYKPHASLCRVIRT